MPVQIKGDTLEKPTGDPGRIRTCNLPLRRGLLYPVEPRGRVSNISLYLTQRARRLVLGLFKC